MALEPESDTKQIDEATIVKSIIGLIGVFENEFVFDAQVYKGRVVDEVLYSGLGPGYE